MTEKELLSAHSRSLPLQDGRVISLLDVGQAEGQPLLLFHGWPSSRAGALSWHERAKALGVRVIGIDRPGIGLSTPKPGRTILDWPQDIEEIADQLGLERFSVAGVSGGGPYALACAYKIPHRLHAVGSIAGMGDAALGLDGMRDANKMLFSLARKANWLLRFFFWAGIGRFIKEEAKLKPIIQKMLSDLPDVDKTVLSSPGLEQKFVLELQESFHQGAKWIAKEGALYTMPWGFRYEDLPKIPIHVWHGELDVNVPIRMNHLLVERAPHVQGHFFPDEGHLSLLAHKMDEILQALTTTQAPTKTPE
ncbi:MAG: alpha/beta hydrolase [Myxococcales bacterium]|nr:alpha/beta hydrolase [Myxococcales bacterium]